MKKIIAILSAILALAACTKEKEFPDVVPEDDQPIVVNITIDRADAFDDANTRARVKKTWADGDVVFVFFQGVAVPKYLEMKYSSATDKFTATFKNGLAASNLGASGTMTAVYLPYGSSSTVSNNKGHFGFNPEYRGQYYQAEQVEYTYNSGELKGKLTLAAPKLENGKYIHFDVSGYDASHAYTLYQDYVGEIIFTGVMSNGTVNRQFGTTGEGVTGYIDAANNILSFSGVLDASAVGQAVDYQFSINDETASVLYTRDSGTKTLSKSASIGIGDLNSAPWNAMKYVDLGFTVDGAPLYWATANVGASNPRVYGNFFAWGDPNGYAISGYVGHYTSYHNFWTSPTYELDANKNLLPQYDGAHMSLKGLWRMPTEAELQALYDHTTHTFEWGPTDGPGMYVNGPGVTLTSTVEGYTDKSIFLRAAGYVIATSANEQDRSGNYWSATESFAGQGYSRAYNLYFNYDNHEMHPDVSDNSATGNSIRPVFTLRGNHSGSSGHTDDPIDHEYVDMGYGMKWATMNIGASGPSDFGDYFAWGETYPKSDYTLSTYFDPDYQIYRYQSGPTLGRPVRLKREDDAAHVLWGDDWRMPNFEEVKMLADKTKFTWTVDPEAGGYKVTSKQTGKSISLPFSGVMSERENYGLGTWGGVWASSHRSTSSDLVTMLYFADHDSRGGVLNSRYRSLGFPIRPIRVNKVNGHEYIDLGNGLGWAVENLGTDDSHPAGRADTFAEGDPATAKWGAPWRTPTKEEWQWVLDTENCYREKSADYETAGLWFINQESRSGTSLISDRAIFLPNTGEGLFLYWTSSRDADGNLLYISVTDTYIKYIKSIDTKYQTVRPVFSLSELKE